MPHVWPEVPQDQPAYVHLSTDFWPWPEVLADLAERPELSAVLELQQGTQRARALWAEGEALGAFAENVALAEDATLADLARRWPRAQVSLYTLSPQVARLVWACRAAEPAPAAGEWQAVQSAPAFRGFSGVVRSDAGDSYWSGGALLVGTAPRPGDRAVVLTPPQAPLSQESVLSFYNAALRAARPFELDAHWRASTLELADEHPCLDPFAREVVYEQGELSLNLSVPAEELLPALRDAFALTLVRAGRRAHELPLGPVQTHPLWPLSGLEVTL